MKKLLVAALVAAAVAIPNTAQAKDRWMGPCSGWQMGETMTPARWRAKPDVGVLRMRRLIACAFAEFAPGQSVYALAVADRESSFYPWALNPSGCAGLFQHQTAYWPGRAAAYLNRGWFGKWPASPFDARANAIVTARMVAASGWGPWGG